MAYIVRRSFADQPTQSMMDFYICVDEPRPNEFIYHGEFVRRTGGGPIEMKLSRTNPEMNMSIIRGASRKSEEFVSYTPVDESKITCEKYVKVESF